MFSRNASGMTLVELSIATAIISLVMIMVGSTWLYAMNTWAVEETYVDLSAWTRNAARQISEELSFGTTRNISSATPPVQGLSIPNDSPTSVTFQTPTSADGTQWSSPITIRGRNEDVNGNLRLDSGEDMDGNGVLDRVVERLQDVNGDGDFNDPGEQRILARDIDAVTFALAGTQVNLSLTGRRQSGSRSGSSMVSSIGFSVLLQN